MYERWQTIGENNNQLNIKKMKASELKVGQDFKWPGQRSFRRISEIKEIKPSDRARQEHIGKLLFYFSDDSQMLLSKDDEVDIQLTELPTHMKIKKDPNRYEFEVYLNNYYSKTMNNKSALQHFIYLTITKPNPDKVISLEKLNIAIRTKQCGTILRKYDPERFGAEYESNSVN